MEEIIKKICSVCENNLHFQNKRCPFRSISNEYCVEIEKANDYVKQLKQLKENDLYKHRCEVANEFIESRKENMCTDHYNDLKYIVNECGLESTW